MEPSDEAVQALYEALHDKMLKVAYRMVGSVESAEDLVQHAFLLALFQGEPFLRHPCPEGWLMRPLQNLALNERRRLQRHPEVPLDAVLYRAGREPEAPLDTVLPRDLSREDREILIWRFEEDLSYGELADRLGISETGCRSRVFRAVKRCRALWEKKS